MAVPKISALLMAAKTIALVGASPRPDRASYSVMAYLLANGYRVIPVNPAYAGTKILQQPVVCSLLDIDERVDIVNVFRRSEYVAELYRDVLKMWGQPKMIWLQQNIIDLQVATSAEQSGIVMVMDLCLMLEHRRVTSQ